MRKRTMRNLIVATSGRQTFWSNALFFLTMSCLTPSIVKSQESNPESKSFTEVVADGSIVFRLEAKEAKNVVLKGSDLPGGWNNKPLARNEAGVWELKASKIPPGAYRYQFSIDGLSVLDPKNLSTSQSNQNLWSLVSVSGSEWFDMKDVPHGALAERWYPSKVLQKHRRMHVYTPPGYESSKESYPIFYLLHGAFDGDDAWSTVGQANQIFDNLIAAGKMKPSIVVMTDGHMRPFLPGARTSVDRQVNEFAVDFRDSVVPYVEAQYRHLSGAANRAIAGLSMGGAQTLDVAFERGDEYAYVGVFSSGIFGINGGPNNPEPSDRWEKSHLEAISRAVETKPKLFWFAIGKDDFLLETSRASVRMLESKGLKIENSETDGGHTWDKWRDYLIVFSQRIFQ